MDDLRLLKFTYICRDERVGGREMLACVNSTIIDELFGKNVFDFVVRPNKTRSLVRKIKALFGWLDGLDVKSANRCVDILKEERCDVLYIEGSNYGRLVRFVKKEVPSCRVIVFFHNVELRFFWGAFKYKRDLKSLSVLIANTLSEYFCIKYSDDIVCLTNRDSKLLERIYGRPADHICPMSVRDQSDSQRPAASNLPHLEENFGIFVGSAFYANVEAVRWLANEVAGNLNCTIYILGRGFEEFANEFSNYPNLIVVGEVDSLVDWYSKAKFSVAPIFDGSGMKTKIAESLMFGRPVVATEEAFVGYEDVLGKVGFVCNSPTDFVNAISQIVDGDVCFEEDELKSLFRRMFSYQAARGRMAEIFSAQP